MGGLRPIGSEKLQGMAKINRILEIARYKENIPKSINENKSTEYSVNLADGYTYEIVKEKMGYIIKQQITEGFNEYIEPMKNRKYYPSYSQALKRLNLMAKEMNTLYENKNGTALFEGDKKYVLKMNSGLKKTDDEVKDEIDEQTPPAPAPAPPAPATPTPAPAPAPAPEGEMAPPSPDDMAPPAPDDMGDEEEVDTEEEGTDEEITFKTIQKLTGKLAQKIRDFEGGKDEEEEGMDGNDVKYVINSILSALDLSVLDEDDIDEIMSRLEGEEGEEGEEAPEEGGEMEGEEPAPPPAPEEEGELAPPSPEGEMAEMMTMGNMLASKIPSVYGSNIGRKMGFDEDFDMEDDIIDVCSRCNGLGMDDLTGEDCEMCGGTGEEGMSHKKMRGARKHLRHGTFSESTIDNIISKYFEVEENEKYLTESRKENSLLEHLRETKSEIKRLSKTSRQANVAMTFLKENKNSTLVGISNKNNLIFKLNSFNYKISPKGNIL